MSQVEVDKIIPQSGTTLTIGDSGDTITVPSGVTFDASSGSLAGTLTTAAQPNITSVGTLTSFTSTGIDDNATSTAITIDSSQNVAIGTTSGNKQLTLESSGSNCGIRINNSVTGRPVSIGFDDSNDLTIWNNSTNGNIIFYNQTGSGSERLRINNAGKIFTNQTAQFHNCVTIGGAQFTGDFQIEVSGLTALNGNSHRRYGMRLSYASIAGNATDAQQKDVLLNIGGLSSWGVQTVDTGGGTIAVTLDSATSTSLTFTVTTPGASTVGAYVATLFANDNSTMECNG